MCDVSDAARRSREMNAVAALFLEGLTLTWVSFIYYSVIQKLGMKTVP